MQDLHEKIVADVLRRSFGEPEFLGYVIIRDWPEE